MSSSPAIVLCDATLPEGVAASHVACVNLFDLTIVRKQFPDAVDLLGIPIEMDTASILRSIDNALSAEASLRPEQMRWAPLALQRMFTRYVHYLQFKRRIASWLERDKPDVLYLSSAWDKYLILACQTCCENASIPFHLLHGPFSPYSAADPFSFAETLPPESALDLLFLVKLLGVLTRWLGSVIYEFYPNLSTEGFDAISFKWWRSVAAKGHVVAKLKTAFRRGSGSTSFADYNINLHPDQIPPLRSAHWDAFGPDEFLVLRSALASFQAKFYNNHLDRLHQSLMVFFQHARLKRLIALDPLIPSSRLLVLSARRSGVPCDFLPHGLTAEDRMGSPDSDFSPLRVLAWNEASARQYRIRGYRSLPISHPRNSGNEAISARSAEPIFERSFLVLASTSRVSQIDAQDRDLVDILEALQGIGARNVALKLHAAAQNLAELQQFGIWRLMESCDLPVSLLDGSLDSRTLMTSYDFLIIGGATTAIVEAALAQMPFVIFRAETNRIGCLDGTQFSVANSSAELSRLLREFDYPGHRESCLTFSRSLVGNPHPLDSCLN